jgi:hypothetical protein
VLPLLGAWTFGTVCLTYTSPAAAVAVAGDGNASLASGATTPTYGRSMNGTMPAFSPNSSPSKRSLSRQNSQGNLGGHKRVGGVRLRVTCEWDVFVKAAVVGNTQAGFLDRAAEDVC